MNISIQLSIKEYIWNSLRRISNNFSKLIIKDQGNGYIQCLWEISPLDDFKIKLNKSCFYAIRLFDITNNRNIDYATCIMKEIQVSKFQSSISFHVPINKGVYYCQFGYRKRNGEWRSIAYKDLNLGYRIKNLFQRFEKDDWFVNRSHSSSAKFDIHEKAYQLSLNTIIGGSENLVNDLNY